jgi:hypothetical protein
MRQVDKRVSIDLEAGIATITHTLKIDLFENNRFMIESDCGGFSCIEKREDGYHHVNYLRERNVLGEWIHGSEKPIDDRKISASGVKKIIEEVLTAHNP